MESCLCRYVQTDLPRGRSSTMLETICTSYTAHKNVQYIPLQYIPTVSRQGIFQRFRGSNVLLYRIGSMRRAVCYFCVADSPWTLALRTTRDGLNCLQSQTITLPFFLPGFLHSFNLSLSPPIQSRDFRRYSKK